MVTGPKAILTFVFAAQVIADVSNTETSSPRTKFHARTSGDLMQAEVQANGKMNSSISSEDIQYMRRADQLQSSFRMDRQEAPTSLVQTAKQPDAPDELLPAPAPSGELGLGALEVPNENHKICEVGGSGLILPLFGDNEQRWPNGLRLFLYFIGLLWMFEAVSIIADVFMAGIEKITSAKKRVYIPEIQAHVTCTVWNGTVANLTLMALGSSAPEILLSLIELLGNDFYSGDLGPGTIVGSAAFNLLIISALCVLAVPTGTVRYVRYVSVYAITAFFSVFAYVWLVTIVSWSSKNKVTRTEAGLTLSYFFVLLVLAFLADKGYIGCGCFGSRSPLDEIKDWRFDKEDPSPEQLTFIAKKIREASPKELTDEEVEQIVLRDYVQPQTKATHRRISANLRRKSKPEIFQDEPGSDKGDKPDKKETAKAETGEPTKDTAKAEEKEEQPQEKDSVVDVLDFEKHEVTVGGKDKDFIMKVIVMRSGPAKKKVTCKIETEESTAKADYDFVPIDKKLTFLPGQTMASVNITIKAASSHESNELFRVILSDASEGAKINEVSDGGAERSILSVIIEAEDVHSKGAIGAVLSKVNWDEMQLARVDWGAQFVEAWHCGGSKEDQKDSTWWEYTSHLRILPAKLLFATVPPPGLCGGWATFVVALIEIGAVTAIIGDMASLLGCCAGIKDEITAITFVAVGTSLPDTFASMGAAKSDPYADNSIGNITGSNSVNVFLGLGLPWLIGAIYWEGKGQTPKWKHEYSDLAADFPDGAFVVKAGSLESSVIVFVSCALTCIGILLFRRMSVGGELGGPTQQGKMATAASIILLWVVYVGYSIVDTTMESGNEQVRKK